MSELTVDDKNEIIAIFDGWELKKIEKTDCFVKDGYRKYYFELNYDSDWSWLMPVAAKICNDNSSKLTAPMNGISDSIMPYINATRPLKRALMKVDMSAVYENVYQFICWYNKIKEQQP
jgi:hypothetical protein